MNIHYEVNLEIITKQFFGKVIKINVKGILIKIKKILYIFSLHHNLPINKIMLRHKNNLHLNIPHDLELKNNILINSNWSEVLIIKKELNIKTNIKIQNKIPILNTLVNCNNNKIEIIDYEYINYIPFSNASNIIRFQSNIEQIDFCYLPYIVCKNSFKNIPLSGTPVLINNKLIGLFSKRDNDKIYIIPIYIFIKNMNKINNNNFYIFKNLDDIVKINNNPIKDNKIYHNKLHMYINIYSYCILEGDDKYFIIKNKYQLFSETKMEKLDFIISNEIDIIKSRTSYKINLRLLTILRYLNLFEILNHILYNIIELHKYNLWIKKNI
jgi:hypothetical protein